MKAIIRKDILNKRKYKDNVNASKICFDALILSNILDKFNSIGIYYPIRNEINLMPLIDYYPNKKFYLPKTLDTLVFREYNGTLIDGPFKTKETTGSEVNRDMIECFIIPCVGVNKELKRIGYGKGYYDRYLSGYSGLKIGICYKEDSNLDLELDEYDLKLDILITG